MSDTNFVVKNGLTAGNAVIDAASGNITGNVFVSTVSNAPPFIVASTAAVANLYVARAQVADNSGGGQNSNVSIFSYLNLGNIQTQIDITGTSGLIGVNYALVAIDNINNYVSSVRLDSIYGNANVYTVQYAILNTSNTHAAAIFDLELVSGNVVLYATGNSSNVSVQGQKSVMGTNSITGSFLIG